MVQHNDTRLAILGDLLMGMEPSAQKVALAWGIGQYAATLLALESIDSPDDKEILLELLDDIDREEIQPALEME